MTIDLTTGIGFKKTVFPDSQIHIKLDDDVLLQDRVNVACSLRSYNDVMELLMISNALDINGIEKLQLSIDYLITARYDRVMVKGDSFDLAVVAKLINDCNFKSVFLLDVHSEVSTKLINNSHNNFDVALYESYSPEKHVYIVCPDKGAIDRINLVKCYIDKFKDIIYCDKERDEEGKISLSIKKVPYDIFDSEVVVIDDLCDGGGTFIAIAKQLPSEIKKTLIVTHGIFSKGFEEFNKYYDSILCTNSFSDVPDSYNNGMQRFKTNVKQVKL